ncbi:MAG: hypothetical protein WBE72_23615 [Terracidiphilus sp.]
MPETTRFGRSESDKPFRPETSANNPREIVIRPNWNVRNVNRAEVREQIDLIKASILARVNADPPLQGLIKPIEVSYDPATGKHFLEDGLLRLTSYLELWNEGHELYIPNVRVKGTEAQLYAQHMAGNGGLPLTQVEIAEGCRRLAVGYLWTPEMISAHICKSKRFVTDALALADVPQEAKRMISEGEVTAPRVLSEVRQAQKRNEPASEAVDSLKKAVENRPKPPEPAQRRIPGTPSPKAKTKPLARPKAKSRHEHLLELADELAQTIVDDKEPITKVLALAKKYIKARGK